MKCQFAASMLLGASFVRGATIRKPPSFSMAWRSSSSSGTETPAASSIAASPVRRLRAWMTRNRLTRAIVGTATYSTVASPS